LSDEDVIQKVTQCPTKLKAKAKRFLSKLQENGVTLDTNGEIEWGNVDKNVVNQLKDKEQLVKITLMQADLEFEYPQKLEKMMVKADVLRWLDEEEEKLKLIAMAVSNLYSDNFLGP
jgi:hypothetical protein